MISVSLARGYEPPQILPGETSGHTKNCNMKKLLLICLVAFTACQSGVHRPYIVFTAYGTGWKKSSTSIRCDSVKLFNKGYARVYIDGAATDLYADEILISNN